MQENETNVMKHFGIENLMEKLYYTITNHFYYALMDWVHTRFCLIKRPSSV